MNQRKKQFIHYYLLALVLGVGIFMVLNALGRRYFYRIDITQDKIYSVSRATQKILRQLQEKVRVTLYISHRIQAGMENLKTETLDKFKEIAANAEGKFAYRVVDPYAELSEMQEQEFGQWKKKGESLVREEFKAKLAEDLKKKYGADWEKSWEANWSGELKEKYKGNWHKTFNDAVKERFFSEVWSKIETIHKKQLERNGINELQGRVQGRDKFEIINFYSGISITYLDKPREVINPYTTVDNLEYELMSRILRMQMKEKPKIGFFDGQSTDSPTQIRNPYQQPPQSEYGGALKALSAVFQVEKIGLTEKDPIGPDTRCLIVAQPKDLTPRQVFEISKFISQGGRAIFLASGVGLNKTNQFNPVAPVTTGLEALFTLWGLELKNRVVMDTSCVYDRQAAIGDSGITFVEEPLPYFQIIFQSGLNTESPITKNLEAIILPFSSEIRLDPDRQKLIGLASEKLMESTANAWSVDPGLDFIQKAKQIPPANQREGKKLGGIILSGAFPFLYQNKAAPQWANLPEKATDRALEKQASPPAITPVSTKIILISSPDIFKDYVMKSATGNQILLNNVVEVLALGEDLMSIRSKVRTDRILKETTSVGKWLIRVLNIALIPLLLAFFGILRYYYFSRTVKVAQAKP